MRLHPATLILAVSLVATPAVAQVDVDTSYTQGAADNARNLMLNQARDARARNGYTARRAPDDTVSRARVACVEGRRKLASGIDRPRLRNIAAMCARMGW